MLWVQNRSGRAIKFSTHAIFHHLAIWPYAFFFFFFAFIHISLKNRDNSFQIDPYFLYEISHGKRPPFFKKRKKVPLFYWRWQKRQVPWFLDSAIFSVGKLIQNVENMGNKVLSPACNCFSLLQPSLLLTPSLSHSLHMHIQTLGKAECQRMHGCCF